jgi:signal transduction histidine kinase
MTTNEIPPENEPVTLLLARLKDIAAAAISAAEAGTLEQVLERIARVSGELVNARYTALGIPDEKGGLKYFKVAGLSSEQIRRIAHLPVGRGLLGAIMQERKAVRLERMQEDPRSGGFCAQHPPMTSLLGVPIQLGERLFGLLYLCDRMDGQPFSEQDQWVIETMAGYAALAIVGSQLSEQQSQLTLLKERERVGMELHDGVIQSLYAIGMHLDLLSTAPDRPIAELKPVIHDLNAVIEDIRRYILDLKTSSYRQRTIYESLREVVARLHVPDTVTVEIQAPDIPPPLSPLAFEAVCQMAQEAISNTLRHANASHINISTSQDESAFQVVIADDGQGFDLGDTSKRAGLGLRNIQQRALLSGGQVHIDTAPGRGTRLTITVPTQTL